MIGAANKESSHTLYKTNECSPPMKMSEQYSSMAFLVSPVYGTYLITISWSILVESGYKAVLASKISSTQDFFVNSLDLKVFYSAKFLPSLFPKWL